MYVTVYRDARAGLRIFAMFKSIREETDAGQPAAYHKRAIRLSAARLLRFAASARKS
jgi:hypothetical protein